jgi:hypothetical protein
MNPNDLLLLRDVFDELANSLQAAIGIAGGVRRKSESTAYDAHRLEQSIARAVSALKRLQRASA